MSSSTSTKTDEDLSSTTCAFPPKELRGIVKEVAELLVQRGESVCVAETAAGGLISASLLSYPGASKFYNGGLTLYTLPSRQTFLSWTAPTPYTGPTPSIVSSLATSTLTKLPSTYCLSESGTAGPTGGETKNRTPGYVALAVAVREDGGNVSVVTKELDTGLAGNREANMVAFAKEGLTLVRDVILQRAAGKDVGERERAGL